MKPADVASLLQIATSTVRLWASEYRPFLSSAAAGGDGQHRNFSDQDLRVLHFINRQKQAGVSGDEIHAALLQLQARDWDGLPDMPTNPDSARVPMIPTAAANAAIDSERRGWLREIATLQESVIGLKSELTAERADKERLLREIGELMGRLAEAQTMIKLYESGRLKPPE